jgi:NAD-dependent dihydropyrimidine dehydrogenase PreA subunit
VIELPKVDETRCTGCGDCVIVCPEDCLEMQTPAERRRGRVGDGSEASEHTERAPEGALPRLARPLCCTSCSLCVLICPEEALKMVES